jgi:hypothetical protein
MLSRRISPEVGSNADRYASQMQVGRTDALQPDRAPQPANGTRSAGADSVATRAGSDRPSDSGGVALQAPVSGGGGRQEITANRSTTDTRSDRADEGRVIRDLVAEARRRLESLNGYQVQLSRQERVGSSLLPTESVVMSIRRNPQAVRLEWPDGPNKGREAIYSADGDGLLHVNLPGSIVSRTAFPPNSPLVLSNSRHPITEAGFDKIVADLERDLAAAPVGQPGGLKYLGVERPTDLANPCYRLERAEPNGETWTVYLDKDTKLPAMVLGVAGNGNLLERYVFKGLRTDVPELVASAAFDPDSRWGPARGLFGRLARSQDSAAAVTARQ